MVRTWQFTGAPTQGPQLRVAVREASVSQSSAGVQLRVTNQGAAPLQLEVESLEMRLEDGTTCEGQANLLRRALDKVKGGLAVLGIGKGPAPTAPLEPGEHQDIDVTFRIAHRDLRRHPLLQIDLSRLRVDGAPSGLAAIQLVAPARAPIGEDI